MGLLGNRPPKVEKLVRKRDIDGLVHALSYEDLVQDREGQVVDLGAEVRRSAVEGLGGIDSRAALQGLVQAFDDPEEAVRITAVRGLRDRRDPLATEQLAWAATNWTEERYARAREESVEALAKLKDPMTPRRVVAGMMTRAGDLDADGDREVLRRLMEAGGHDALGGTVDDLVARLSDATVAARARQLLVWIGEESVDPLLRALDDEARRREAIFALGSIHDSRAVDRLGSILLSDDPTPIRTAAAWALGEIKDPGAVETLLVATGDAEYKVRSEASQSFDKLGNAAVAVAMSALILPALENGAGAAPKDAIEVGDEEDQGEESEGRPLAEAPTAVHQVQPQPTPQPTQAAPQPPAGPVSQAGPILRRLLGWRANP